MRNFTWQHLVSSKKMPLKKAPRGMSEEDTKQFERRTKRERQAIADYYRLRRCSRANIHLGMIDEAGVARRLHRVQSVVSASEARLRIKHL